MVESIRKKRFNIILFFMFMVDFIYTYLGIHYYKCIVEGNPLMVWLFEIPFINGLVLRLVYSTILFTLCVLIQKKYKYYTYFINSLLIVYIGVMILHFRWLFPALNEVFISLI